MSIGVIVMVILVMVIVIVMVLATVKSVLFVGDEQDIRIMTRTVTQPHHSALHSTHLSVHLSSLLPPRVLFLDHHPHESGPQTAPPPDGHQLPHQENGGSVFIFLAEKGRLSK
jgi:hypothetical protein